MSLVKEVLDKCKDINEESINGVELVFSSRRDRLRGESYSVYNVRDRKMVVPGLTMNSADELAGTDSDWTSGSAAWVSDYLN